MRRLARRLAIPLCCAMLSGACHSGKKGSAGVSDTRPTKEDIKVGAIFDLSGPTSDTGTPYSEGIRDYVE